MRDRHPRLSCEENTQGSHSMCSSYILSGPHLEHLPVDPHWQDCLTPFSEQSGVPGS